MSGAPLTVHQTTKRPRPECWDLHLAAAMRVMTRCEEAVKSGQACARSDLLKAVNHGVRGVCGLDRSGSKIDPAAMFELCSLVRHYIAQLTPRELMQVFPIDKTYDGERWGEKDYLYSMAAAREHGLDRQLGEETDNFLWDYMSNGTRFFTLACTMAASALRRQQTGKGIMEEWCQEQGIPTYTMRQDPDSGKQFLFDADNGRSIAVTKKPPRHLRLV